jgi:hypothetical protein
MSGILFYAICAELPNLVSKLFPEEAISSDISNPRKILAISGAKVR